jgi:hypothetical protein
MDSASETNNRMGKPSLTRNDRRLDMQIIVKKAFNFQDFEITVNPRNGEKVAKLLNSFKAFPSMRPQTVPDWIIDDGLFDMAVADGSLVVIGEIPPKTAKAMLEPTLAVQQEQSDEEKQAELEAMLSTPVSELVGQVAPARWPKMGKSQFPSPGLL